MNLPKTGVLVKWGKDKRIIAWWFSTYIHVNGKQEPSIIDMGDVPRLNRLTQKLCFKLYAL